MADSQYPYPPDRFDDEADAASFHGAHRAELPFWRENLLYLIIIGAAAVLLVVLLFLIGSMGGDDDKRAEGPSASETTAAEETTTPAEEPSEEPAPADKSTPVMVLNAGGINGMAGAWEEALTGAGWEKVDIGTAENHQQEPVVFYRDEADAASAQELAESVGAGEARQSDEYDARITFLAVELPAEDFGSADEGDSEG